MKVEVFFPESGIKGRALGRIFLFTALVIAGLLGNHFNYQIFLNIDFLFGSIFSMLALQLCGFHRGVFASLLISRYTYVL